MRANSHADGPSKQFSANHESKPLLKEQPKERRSVPRVETDGWVQWWKQGDPTPRWGRLKNVSAGGCCIKTPLPIAAGTTVIVVLTVKELKKQIRAVGEVRSYTPQKGMGISFTLAERILED
jgi:hypothetical protein